MDSKLATSTHATLRSVLSRDYQRFIDGRPPTFSMLQPSGVEQKMIFSWSTRTACSSCLSIFLSFALASFHARVTRTQTLIDVPAVTIVFYSLIDCNCFRFPRSSIVRVTRIVRRNRACMYVCVCVWYTYVNSRSDRRPICIFEPRSDQ